MLVSILVLCFFCACSDSAVTYPYGDSEPVRVIEPGIANEPTTPGIPDAISRVVLKRNIPYREMLDRIVNAVESKGFKTRRVDEASGRIVTEPFDVVDGACERYRAEQVPLECRITFFFKVEKLTNLASSCEIRYREVCDFPGDTEFYCPGSKAEHFMFSIAKSISPDFSTVTSAGPND